jgi:signal peptidase II
MAIPARASRLSVAALVIAAALAGDQLSKAWVLDELRGRPRMQVLPGVLEFDFAFNTGSAFGLFATSPHARVVFIVMTTLALVYMAALVWRLPGEPRSARTTWTATVALALMIGGALGNLGDRLWRVCDVRIGLTEQVPFWLVVEHPRAYADAVLRPRSYVDVPRHGVVDFIVVYYWPGARWPSFNLADTWLVIGVGLLLGALWRSGALGKPPPNP